MIYFCLVVLSLFLTFSIISKKYNNPFQLYFIFGKKGAGKSLYMVKLMRKYLRKGWTVYTDIDNVNIPGIRIFRAHDLESFAPAPRSAIFIDEAGILFDNRSSYNKFQS